MPWLPMYIDKSDHKLLIDWLSAEEDIAFIIGDGPKKWKAVHSIEQYEDIRYCLWHIKSGPLPLLCKNFPDGKISDPFKGWKEKRTGSDPSVPYFGPGHPGVYWLNAKTESLSSNDSLGLSSFEWIGNWYKPIGVEAPIVTKKWWERLKRWVKKNAIRIPRYGEWDGDHPEIWAFPSALESIKNGINRDGNP